MRILRLIPYFASDFGGPVNHVKNLTSELEREGHETVIYTSAVADSQGQGLEPPSNGIEVHPFHVDWSVGDYFYTPGMRAALSREEFDLIHTHCFRNYQSDLAAWLAGASGKPLVLTAHGTLPWLPDVRDMLLKGIYDFVIGRRVLGQCGKLVALSSREENDYQRLSVPSDRIVKIHHGVDAELFSPSAKSGQQLNERCGFESRPVITYAGRLHKRKGLEYLLQAFALVKREVPETVLLLCGPDHGFRDALTRIISAHPNGDDVVLAGAFDHLHMPQVYNASTVVVLPAQFEVFGQVLGEAAACGRALVTTRWGWAAEFFEDEKDCLFVDRYGDVRGLGNALTTLLLRPQMRRTLGANARKKVTQNLSWRKCAQEHLGVYESLTSVS